jgi:CRISPR/Cas system-associated endonuclease Cas3-HD
MLREQDIKIWQAAQPYLDVRSNDEHTLYSYSILKRLIEFTPEGEADVLLPAILLHDTGWKMIPADKILHAFGPNNKYPELTRQHELEGVEIAKQILSKLGYPSVLVEKITAIIDGHDTTKVARSTNDALLKEADKLWRYTTHGIKTIQGWFNISETEVLDILENFVLPTFLTENGLMMAKMMLSTARCKDYLKQKIQ